MHLLYLTSISLILPYILQTHSSQNIHTYFSYILQTPYLKIYIYIYIYFLPSPYILKDIKHSFKNMLQKPFSWKAYNYNTKSSSYERHKFMILKVLLMEDNITHI